MTEDPAPPALRYVRSLVQKQGVNDASDGDLLARFIAHRDEQAFAALVRRHGGMVQRLCGSLLRNQVDADDAFQATFLVLTRQARAIRKAGSLASWLYGVAYRTALKARKARATRRRHEGQHHERQVAAASPPGPLDELTWREAQAIFHEELARLPDKYRAPLVLCYLENKTQDDVGVLLDWPQGKLKGMLERGRELLRKRLSRRGLGPAFLLLGGVSCGGNACAAPLAVADTVRAALSLLAQPAGSAAAAAVSNEAASLAEGVIRTMTMCKIKLAATGLMTAILMGSFAVFLVSPLTATSLENSAGEARSIQAPPRKKKQTAPKEAIDPLESARMASAQVAKLRSAVATATWEEYFQGSGEEKPWAPRTKATVKIYFDRGKYLLRFDYQTKQHMTGYFDKGGLKRDERWVEWKPKEFVILWDGKDAYAITFSDRIRPSGCMMEIYSKLPLPETNHYFFTDAARLQIVNIEALIKNVGRDTIEMSRLPTGGYRGTCRFKDWKGRDELEIQPELGFHVTSSRVFNPDETEPVQTFKATWKKTKGVWHIQRFVTEFDNRKIDKDKGFFQRSILQFDSFNPEAKVDGDLFKLESLKLPARVYTIDRRPGAEQQNGGRPISR
jgi:RNA polymerase sigma factor (sigma-70 family)